MSPFAQFLRAVDGIEGTDACNLHFAMERSGSLSVSLVSQLTGQASVMTFASIFHFKVTAAPEASGLWMIDRVEVDQTEAGARSFPLGLAPGTWIRDLPALVGVRAVGGLELEVVAAQADVYIRSGA